MHTIFDYITKQETEYSKEVTLGEGWDWSMKKHLLRSFLYLNGQFLEDNENRYLRPNKNIILPILNIQKRTEGFDVKDIEVYIDNKDQYYKSFLVRKKHDRWSLENNIDTFIDEMVDSYSDYGGVLVRKTNSAKPEIVDLRTIAFCNQYDILNNPFGILHEYSFSQLRKIAKQRGWGNENSGADIDVETLIELAKSEDPEAQGLKVYEVHGSLPTEWLEDEELVGDSEMDINQIQIVSFYQNTEGVKQGVTLFKKKMPELPFKFLKRDKINNRALGRGGIEELFEPQEWTNFSEVKAMEMLDSASKTLFYSDDPQFKSRNNLNDADNNEVFSLQESRIISQIDTFPRNLQVFNQSVDRFFQHAQLIGSASDPLLGKEPNSGTPFKLFEAQQIEGHGMHRYRQGQLASFMDEIYRDWIIPQLAKEIVKEDTFLEELSAEEVQMVAEKMLIKKANDFKKKIILSGQRVNDDLVNAYKDQVQADIIKKGNKWFIKILKDEMKDVELNVRTNIAGKQKNLALLTDKLVNVVRQYLATPELRQDPEMSKLLNVILESSGLSPINFGPSPINQAQPVQPAKGGSTEAIAQLGNRQVENTEQPV